MKGPLGFLEGTLTTAELASEVGAAAGRRVLLSRASSPRGPALFVFDLGSGAPPSSYQGGVGKSD